MSLRKSINKNDTHTRLTDEQRDFLERYAKQKKTNVSDALRLIVEKARREEERKNATW